MKFLFAFIAILFIGCNQADRRQVQEFIVKDKPLIIKGFYLGMEIGEVEVLIEQKYNGVFKHCKTDKEKSIKCGDSEFQFDDTGKLWNFTFYNDEVHKLFDVTGMDFEEFSQQFVNAYSIPQMSRNTQDVGFGVIQIMEYTSPNGFKIKLTNLISISVAKVPKLEERGFN